MNNADIYSPELSAKILAAMESVALSNNGWAWIKKDSALISGLRVAGYVVIETETGTKAFSSAGWNAMAEDCKRYGAAPARAIASDDGPDYEARILARQDWLIANY